MTQALAKPTPHPMRVIWSARHTGPMNEEYLHGVIDRAAAERVSGFELSGKGIERYIDYRDYPAVSATLDPAAARRNREILERLSVHAHAAGLRFGFWHHEVDGPENLLERVPELKAKDGFPDLESPALYRLITSRLAEFFDRFPLVDEMVLTMTETRFPVFRRPFCAIPVHERVRRVLEAVLAAVEPAGRHLVIRPFSAIRADEVGVREAVESLRSRRVSIMYKTEPFDWHPFLPDEPLIGSVPGREARAETDAGAEYYGMGEFPCSYTRHIERRLAAAIGRGASVAVIRVDRGAACPALGHPVNEGNVLAPTRWLAAPGKPLAAHWLDWCRSVHGGGSPAVYELVERTFDVIQRSLYIDRQAISHHVFPTLEGAKHVQTFGLLEERVPLGHMHRNWGILSERSTLTHEGVLAEKQAALRLTQEILQQFDAAAAAMPERGRQALRRSLESLPLLAEACLAFCRVCIAHVEDAWRRPARAVGSFEAERLAMAALAEQIERKQGAGFWEDMPGRMRGLADGLAAERASELPLRAQAEALPGLVDYVLCGYASEGHRLAKMLHSGSTFEFMGRWVRATGVGPDEACGYTLACRPGRPHRLSVLVAGDGTPRPAVVTAGGVAHAVDPGPFRGFRELVIDLPPADGAVTPVAVHSSGGNPCWLAQITLHG